MVDVTIHGIKFRNVHDPSECKGRHCIVHWPVHTHMDDWPVAYRGDRIPGIWERICPHGIGHPDPSQFDYWESKGDMVEAIHGCDGCCHPEKKYWWG